jgi:predicted Fe-Mo cluster-binding NifX family protein
MKICIPTDTKEGLNAKVFGHFGSAPYFTVYDTEKDQVETIDNTNSNHAHGMCQPISVIGQASINVVICQGMGRRAVEKLNESGIKAYRQDGGTVAEVINKFKTNELEEMTVENACGHHHGGCH